MEDENGLRYCLKLDPIKLKIVIYILTLLIFIFLFGLGLFGALDGTYIKIKVESTDRPRYRSRKNKIAINFLGVCTLEMQFAYVLPG